MPYSLQYGSDFHLKENNNVTFDSLLSPDAPDLALCGDIGDPFSEVYGQFLKWCSNHWRRVFLVPGNHEYFTKDAQIGMGETLAQIRRLCVSAGNNVYCLQKDVFYIPDEQIAIVGTTMWSTPDVRHWDVMTEGFIGSPGSRGEYKAIYTADEYTGLRRPLHPSDIMSISVNQTAWIQKTLQQLKHGGWRCIVLTHYLPTHDLNDARFLEHSLKSCYAVEMKEFFKTPVVAWICGHSHTAKMLQYDTGVRVMLNPYGYGPEHETNGFRRDAVLKLE